MNQKFIPDCDQEKLAHELLFKQAIERLHREQQQHSVEEVRNQVTVCEFIESELTVIRQLYAQRYHEMLMQQQEN